MSYKIQADVADDTQLRRRVTACAASEGIDTPETWAFENRWQLSAQPGWSTAYASAVANGVAEPGRRDDVITDGMILSAVQLLRAV